MQLLFQPLLFSEELFTQSCTETSFSPHQLYSDTKSHAASALMLGEERFEMHFCGSLRLAILEELEHIFSLYQSK